MRAAHFLLPALLLAAPAHAQVDAQRTLQAASIELQRAFPPAADPADTFARLNDFQFSAPTRAGLQAIFGDPHPFRIESAPAPRGKRAFLFTVRPADYRAADGTHVLTTPVVGRVDVTHRGRSVASHADLAALDFTASGGHAELRGMHVDATRERGPYGLWLGANRYSLDSLDAIIGTTKVTLAGAQASGSTRRHGADADMSAAFDLGDMRIGGEPFGLRSSFALSGLPLKTLASAQDRIQSLSATPTTEETRGLLADVVTAMGSGHVALRVDTFEVRYKNTKASLRGSLRFERPPGTEHAALDQLWQHARGEFELRVPLAFVRAVSGAFVNALAAHANGAAPPPAAAQNAADAVVARMTGGGYARVENDVIVVQLEIRDGALYAGGKKLDLAPPTRPLPGGSQPLPSLPPRRIPERCPLPPFPSAGAPDDKSMPRLRIRIAADGQTADAALLQASSEPAYDQALLSAAKQCRWIPAIVNGKPGALDAVFAAERDAAGEPQLRQLSARP